jgi:hypothetical protein
VKLDLTIGGNAVQADYVSGSGTNTLLFRYTVTVSDIDLDGIALASPVNATLPGVIRDALMNTASYAFTSPDLSSVLVNVGLAPATIIAVTPPANNTYQEAENLDFSLQFSESVFVSGTPRLQLTIGATTRYANYVSGSGTNTLLFRYTVVNGDYDHDGIALTTTIDLNGGTIKNVNLVNAILTFTDPNTSGILVDASAFAFLSLSPPSNGVYKNGNSMNFVANFNRNVTVTGTPRIALTVGASTVYATYATGTGTSALTFTYNPATTDLDLNGIAFAASDIDLNGGTMVDSFSNSAPLTIPAPPSLANVFVASNNLIRWYDFDDTSKITTT